MTARAALPTAPGSAIIPSRWPTPARPPIAETSNSTSNLVPRRFRSKASPTLLINGALDDLQCNRSGAPIHCGAAIGSLQPGEQLQEHVTEAVADDGACTPIANTVTLTLPAAQGSPSGTLGHIATALAFRDTSTCVPGRSVQANPVVTTLSGCDVGYIPLPMTRHLPKGFPTKPSLHADTVCAKVSIASAPDGQSNSKAQLPPNPCDAGYTEFPSADRVPKGWETKPSLNIAATSVCARAVPSGDTNEQSSSPTQLTCDPGWTAFPTLARVPAGWETQTAPRADKSIVCARAATQSSTPAACPAGYALREERCVSDESKGEDSGSSSSRVKQPDVCPIGTVGTPPDCKRMTIEKIPRTIAALPPTR